MSNIGDCMDIGKVNDSSINSMVNTAKDKVDKASSDDFENRLKNAMNKQDDAGLKKACNDFEGIFLKMMYKQMKATVPKSELIESDYGKEVFDSMLDEKLMDEASQTQGMGLSDMLYKQLRKKMEPE